MAWFVSRICEYGDHRGVLEREDAKRDKWIVMKTRDITRLRDTDLNSDYDDQQR